MYTVRPIDKEEWDTFVLSQKYTVFVQSSNYGTFYKSTGEDSWLFGIYDHKHRLVGGSLVVSVHAKRGSFLYLPYGPIIDFTKTDMVDTWMSHIRQFAKEQRYDFVRMSPMVESDHALESSLRSYGYRPSPMHVLAEESWILDITQSEQELFRQMKKNHRNLIHRCKREGVRITMSGTIHGLQDLDEALTATAQRLDFVRFSQEYIVKEFQAFAEQGNALLFRAYLPDGVLDSIAVFIVYGNMMVYRHSASYGNNKKLPTSYLLQWYAIQEAKRRGVRWYNFWGVEPRGAKKSHPFSGIGHFKRGFGGFQRDLLHCHDLPLTRTYWINWCIETLRKHKRGF
jgi:peptidoglycan pentaglycine glycine transferase (the first glycine)